MRRQLALALAALSFYAAAQSLDPGKLISQYIHTAYGNSRGVKETLDIVQDAQGFVWLGTYDGPLRFDGAAFARPLEVGDGDRVPESARTFAVDPSLGMWIGTNNQGLVLFRDRKYRFVDTASGLTNNSVRRVAVDREGTVWAGTVSGLNAVRARKVGDPDSLEVFSPPGIEALSRTQIGFVRETAAGVIAGTGRKDGLYLCDARGVAKCDARWAAELAGHAIYDLARDGEGFWAISDRVLFRVDGKGNVERIDPLSLLRKKSALVFQRISVDPDGVVWIAAEGGVLRYHRGRADSYGQADGLSDVMVNAVSVDAEGNLWVATGKGVDKFSESKFSVYGKIEGLPDDGVNSVLVARDGKVWVCTNDGLGIVAPDGSVSRPSESHPVLATRLRHAFEDREGNVWVAAYGTGAVVCDPSGKPLRVYSKDGGLAGNKVRVALGARDGSVFVGTTTGLSRVAADGSSVSTFSKAEGLAFDYVMCLYEDREGTLWIGSDGTGLQTFRDGAFGPAIDARAGLAGDVVFRISEIPGLDGIWVTTAGGISRIRGGKITNYGKAAGLPEISTFEIVPDANGSLWLTSSAGIHEVGAGQFDEIDSGARKALSARLYDVSSGLRDLPMSTAWSSRDSSGGLWFPTMGGAARLEPSVIPSNPVPPPVVIIDTVVVDGRRYPRSAKAALEPDERRIDVFFSALSFAAPEKVLLQCKLEGFDTDWSPLSDKREATYTNLAPGEYEFLVRAVNNDGVYSSSPASFRFRKTPHFWQTVPFVVLASLLGALAVAAAGYAAYRAKLATYSKRLAAQARELELRQKALDAERRSKEIETALRESYSRFVPADFIDLLGSSSILDVGLGTQSQREMCVMFSDIRGFTSLSESMTPKDNFDFLNRYFGMVAPVIRAEGGFVDKYIGDAVMALFPAEPERALRAGLGIRRVVAEFNALSREAGLPEISVGIGAHLGHLMMGAIGELSRLDMTVISDAVNLASRLEGLNKTYGSAMVVSADIANKVRGKGFRFRFLDKVRVSGKAQAVSVYEVLDAEEKGRRDLALLTMDDYVAGVRSLYSGDLKAAAERFSLVLASSPDDRVARIHLERARSGGIVGDGWDGVVVMDSK